MTQHGIDVSGDRAAIARAREAVPSEIAPDDVVGRRAPALDLVEQLNGRRDLSAGRVGRVQGEVEVSRHDQQLITHAVDVAHFSLGKSLDADETGL